MTEPLPIADLISLAPDRSPGAPPLYRQFYEQLRSLILDGRLAPGTKLPPTRSLATELAVARNTVASAYDQLLAEGYLQGRQGSGTYVSRDLPDAQPEPGDPSRSTLPFSGGLSARGRRLSTIHRPAHRLPQALAPGVPALDHFPFEVWSRLLARSWRAPSAELVTAASGGNHPPLQRAIAAYLKAVRGLRCEPEQVIIVNGAQQGIHLSAQVLLDPGERTWVEEPGYAGIRGALLAAGVEVVPVPVDPEGLDVDAGERLAPDARMASVAPSHQHPLGVVMSLSRRLRLIEWAVHNDAWILEDDYDSEYRYSGRPLAALQGLDRSGRVIYVGSFSKVLFPSLRLGYLVVPRELVDGFMRARRMLDDHASMLAQPALAQFIEEGHFSAHVRRTRRLYAARQEMLLAAARRHLGGLLELQSDEAGMHLIGSLPPHVPDGNAVAAAAAAGVSVQALSAYYSGEPRRQGLVLGYAGYGEAAIERAVARLATALAPLAAGRQSPESTTPGTGPGVAVVSS